MLIFAPTEILWFLIVCINVAMCFFKLRLNYAAITKNSTFLPYVRHGHGSAEALFHIFAQGPCLREEPLSGFTGLLLERWGLSLRDGDCMYQPLKFVLRDNTHDFIHVLLVKINNTAVPE